MSKLTAVQAHQIADQTNESKFSTYVSDVHTSLKRAAERGNYETQFTLPPVYRSKALSVIQYFTLFGYRVSVQRDVVTIGW